MKKSTGFKKTKKIRLDLEKLLETFLMEHQCKGNSPTTITYYKIGIERFIEYLKSNFGNTDLELVCGDGAPDSFITTKLTKIEEKLIKM